MRIKTARHLTLDLKTRFSYQFQESEFQPSHTRIFRTSIVTHRIWRKTSKYFYFCFSFLTLSFSLIEKAESTCHCTYSYTCGKVETNSGLMVYTCLVYNVRISRRQWSVFYYGSNDHHENYKCSSCFMIQDIQPPRGRYSPGGCETKNLLQNNIALS